MKEKTKTDDFSVHNLWNIKKYETMEHVEDVDMGLPDSEEESPQIKKNKSFKSSRNSSAQHRLGSVDSQKDLMQLFNNDF